MAKTEERQPKAERDPSQESRIERDPLLETFHRDREREPAKESSIPTEPLVETGQEQGPAPESPVARDPLLDTEYSTPDAGKEKKEEKEEGPAPAWDWYG